jgi:hypothetical protein
MICYRVLLPHPVDSRLLMIQRDGEWRLPEWDDSTEHAWQSTEHVNRAVAARFGAETTVLRCVADDTDGTAGTRIYELDNHSAPHDVVPASTWIGRGELDMLRISDMDTRALLMDWFMRDAGELALRGSAWTRRGWYIQALAWTVASLRELGVAPAGEPVQLRAWERDFVMRVPTAAGNFCFRATTGSFMHEPLLTEWLAQVFDGSVLDVVAVDADRGWLLQREVAAGALPLEEVREEEEWYLAARRLGEIQAATAARLPELRRLDVPYRGLEVLARRIPALCADTAALTAGGQAALTPGEARRVAALAPSLLTLCEELASCGVADALEHGDLRAASVLSTLGGPVYLEWLDSSVSHPFFSMGTLLEEAVALLPAVSSEARRRLRDSYLAGWATTLPQEHLVRAFEIARILAPVHRAATAHAEVLPEAGYAWELEPVIPRAMRAVLDALAPQ